MISSILIITSLLVICGMIVAKIYESKSGNSVWQKLRLEKFTNKIEEHASNSVHLFERFEAKYIAEYLREVWAILMQFYGAVQKITTQRISRLSNPLPEDHGNRAASFYLKTIKEHKEKNVPEAVKLEVTSEKGTDLSI